MIIEKPASEKQAVTCKSVSFNEKTYYSKKGPRQSVTVIIVFDPNGEPSFGAWIDRQSKKKISSKAEAVVETVSDNQTLSRIRLKGLKLSQVRTHRSELNLNEAIFTASSLTREILKAKPPEDPD